MILLWRRVFKNDFVWAILRHHIHSCMFTHLNCKMWVLQQFKNVIMIHISTVTFQHSSSDYFQVSVQFTYHKRYSYSTWEQTINIIWSNVRHWRCRNISFFSSYWTKFSLKRIFSKSCITYFSLLKDKSCPI